MRVEVINTDGLRESDKNKIEATMKFTRWWEENDTMFCELKNSKDEIIRIFPERVKPFHLMKKDIRFYPASLNDVKVVSRPTSSGGVMTERISGKLRDLRDNTPCDEESTNCGCEKFDEIIDLVDQLDLKDASSEDLRQELKLRGYQTDNLWHIDDVTQNYDCESEEAQEVLIKALDNEATIEQVYLAIDIVADEVFNLKKKS